MPVQYPQHHPHHLPIVAPSIPEESPQQQPESLSLSCLRRCALILGAAITRGDDNDVLSDESDEYLAQSPSNDCAVSAQSPDVPDAIRASFPDDNHSSTIVQAVQASDAQNAHAVPASSADSCQTIPASGAAAARIARIRRSLSCCSQTQTVPTKRRARSGTAIPALRSAHASLRADSQRRSALPQSEEFPEPVPQPFTFPC